MIKYFYFVDVFFNDRLREKVSEYKEKFYLKCKCMRQSFYVSIQHKVSPTIFNINESRGKNMKPFMKYPGGKAKELPLIQTKLPKNIDRYFEPFVGGGSVFFSLNITESYINDFSFDLINLYTLIKDRNKELCYFLIKFDKIWHSLDKRDLSKDDLKKLYFFDMSDYYNFYESSINRKKNVISRLKESGKVIDDNNVRDIYTTARKTEITFFFRFF